MRLRSTLCYWRTALVAGLALGVAFGMTEGFSIFALPLAKSLHISRAAAATMYATYLAAGILWAPAVGWLVDRSRLDRLGLLGLGLLAAGLIAASWVQEVWQLYAAYVLLLSPAETLLVVSSQVGVSRAYPERRGTAMGLAFGCIGLGDLVFFTALGYIVHQDGWRTAYAAGAGATAMGGVLFALLAPKHGQPVSLRGEPVSLREDSAPSRGQPVRLLVRRPQVWFLVSAAVAAGVLDYTIFQNLVPYLESSGYGNAVAGIILGIAAAGYVAGQFGGGWLSDRFGREGVATIAAVLYVLGLIVLLTVPPLWVVAPVVVLMGGNVGAVISCRSASVGDLFQGPSLGRVTSVLYVATIVGAAGATWFGGFSYDQTQSYDLLFETAAIAAAVWVLGLVKAAPRRGPLCITGSRDIDPEVG
ncbi:MAG: MFS transporter [Acidimicrobiales bacterium]